MITDYDYFALWMGLCKPKLLEVIDELVNRFLVWCGNATVILVEDRRDREVFGSALPLIAA